MVNLGETVFVKTETTDIINSLQDSIIVDSRLQISSDNSWPVT